MIFVDDGSPDDARGVVLALIEKDTAVRLVELSRNFGQHRALMTGLRYATGDFVFMIDAPNPSVGNCSFSARRRLLAAAVSAGRCLDHIEQEQQEQDRQRYAEHPENKASKHAGSLQPVGHRHRPVGAFALAPVGML
jgi:hypothetical protein